MSSCLKTCPCHDIYQNIPKCALIKQTTQCYPQHANGIVIVNPSSLLVLDASQIEVKLQEYTGSLFQQWRFECAKNGNFILFNIGTEKVLEVRGDAKNLATVCTMPRTGGSNQLWHYDFSDKNICNPSSGLVLDILAWNFTPGASIITFSKHGGTNQRFSLEFISSE